MRIVHKITSSSQEQSLISLMKTFDYDVLERIEDNGVIDFHFIKNKNPKYYKELKRLEKEYFSYEKFSIIPVIICVVLALGLITGFLVTKIINGSNFDYVMWFLSLLLPALLFIMAGVGYFIYKYFRIFKKVEENKARQAEIIKEAQKLK